MSKGADGVLRRRCLGECLKQGEGRTIICQWLPADQLFCANGCALKCVLCYGPLTDDDKLHTCADCTTHYVESSEYARRGLKNWRGLAHSILSKKKIANERKLLKTFVTKTEGSCSGLETLEKLRVRRLAWGGVVLRAPTLFKRIIANCGGARHQNSGRGLTVQRKEKTTVFGVITGEDLERTQRRQQSSANLGLVAAAAAQLPEEDAHAAELVQATAENVAEDTLADVVAAQADGSGSAASTARMTEASRGASCFAAQLISSTGPPCLRRHGPDRVRGVAAALAQSRPGGWLGEDEASRTPDQIEKKSKRDARRAELRENPDLSKNKQDGNPDVERRKRERARRARRQRAKRKREREDREHEGMDA